MALRIYISGPLQAAEDLRAARGLYEAIAAVCRHLGHDPYLPHEATDPEHARDLTSLDVYQRDITALRAADVVVAHVGAPSSGVGAEIAIAIATGTPVIAFRRPSEKMSRFLGGLLAESGLSVEVVADVAQLPAQLADAIVRTERLAKLNRMTEEASEAGSYEGSPEDYAAALKTARKKRAE
jgi:nucleoside 2-deoxyribosyltransferase